MGGFMLVKLAWEELGHNSSSNLEWTLILPLSGGVDRLTKDRRFLRLEVNNVMIGNYCKIYLDTALSKGDVIGLIQTALVGEVENRATIRTSSCVIDVEDNDDFSQAMRDDPVNGFLYFRYYLDIEPCKDASRGQYVEILSTLLYRLREKGYKAVPACDFEDELPRP
jgi:hypothetical protein